MKVWLKLLIGTTIGVLLAIILPENWVNITALEKTSNIAISIGRYILFPLVLFSVIISIHNLIVKKQVAGVLLRTILYAAIISAFLAIFGSLSVLLLSPERIPVIIQESVKTDLPSFYDTLSAIFPKNFFYAIFQNGDRILPIFVMAVLIGFNLNFNKIIVRPAVQITESLSSIFKQINSFIIELCGLFIIPMAWFTTVQIMNTPELELFKQMLLALAIDTAIIILVLYPIILYFAAGKKNPYKMIFEAIAPAIAGLASGDSLFGLSVQIKNCSDKTKKNNDVSSVSLPLLSFFGKAGTAMITGAAFIVILKSYSSLGVTVSGVIWVSVFAFLSSFAIGAFPGSGVLVSVTLLCTLYGKGIEEGYLILKPILPILFSLSVMLDTLTNSLITLVISHRADSNKDQNEKIKPTSGSIESQL
ncbi:MAG: cation:dicarboxylase symporter family transporter [Spirochaetales bacterium]|nr:cation:dicarboxylase symporter family transporter [Spirochaetales bacterium]